MRYVAFLRAINVGGHVVKMERLRAIFEELGLGEVSTFIASGNVIFTSSGKPDALEAKIEETLERELGFSSATFLRTVSEIRKAVDARRAPEGTNLYVGFLKARPTADAKEAVEALSNEIDRLSISGRELYWSARKSIGASKLSGAAIERALKNSMTLRNVTSLRKLLATIDRS